MYTFRGLVVLVVLVVKIASGDHNWVRCCITITVTAWERPQLLLAKVKKASDRIGISAGDIVDIKEQPEKL